VVFIQPPVKTESNWKSKSILDSCINKYRNQRKYFTQAWLNIKTKVRNRYLEFNTNLSVETNQFRISLVHTRDWRNSMVRVWNTHMDFGPLWVKLEININTWVKFESKPKSIPIVQPILSRNQNQFHTYHTWYQLGINVTRNTIYYFYSLPISHSGCNPLISNLTRVNMEGNKTVLGFRVKFKYEKRNCTRGSFMPCLVPAMISN